MKEYNTRKPNRLPQRDYSLPGYYYLTICTEDRKEWFGIIDDNQMVLNNIGKICCDCLQNLPNYYSNTECNSYIIMPNHIHTIVIIDNFDNRYNEIIEGGLQTLPYRNMVSNNKTYSLSEIVRGFKTFSSKQINKIINNGMKFKWQRSFYDHIIRNDESLDNIRQYINNNPGNWVDDK